MTFALFKPLKGGIDMPIDIKMQEQKKTRMLTIKEVAHFLCVNERTIYRLIKAHRIPGVKIGGQWRFSEKNIQSWIDGKMSLQFNGNNSSTE